MKHPPTRRLIDLPDDVSLDIALIVACCVIGTGALIYLLTI